MLIANSNLVPYWATWEHFNELDARGLAMYGQMTAGSWIYIGSQGIVQGTYETFVEAGRQHYDGKLAGRWVLTAGLGGMGGAQPLAATLAGACSLNIECQQSSIDFRLRTRYVDEQAADLDDALARIARYTRKVARSRSRCAAMPPRSCRNWCGAACVRTWSPTRPAPMIRSTATCPSAGPGPSTVNARKRAGGRGQGGQAVHGPARARHARIPEAGRAHLRLRQQHPPDGQEEGVDNAFDFPGFVPAYIRPLFCRGVGPFRWAALSGDPQDIYKTDAKVKELIPDDAHLHRWLDMARERISFQGLPARICWVGLGSAPGLAWPSTRWCAAASCPRPS